MAFNDPLPGQTGPPEPKKASQPFFVDMVTCETLLFQTVPVELTYGPETNWNVVATAGRNNPNYQYSGAEDTLNFSMTWYANEENREDVLKKCKWLESLSKNNGYDEKPHRIKLMFGNVFNDAEWIVFAAPFKISMFNRTFGMLPTLAVQEVTLKRITTTNRGTNDIRKITT